MIRLLLKLAFLGLFMLATVLIGTRGIAHYGGQYYLENYLTEKKIKFKKLNEEIDVFINSFEYQIDSETIGGKFIAKFTFENDLEKMNPLATTIEVVSSQQDGLLSSLRFQSFLTYNGIWKNEIKLPKLVLEEKDKSSKIEMQEALVTHEFPLEKLPFDDIMNTSAIDLIFSKIGFQVKELKQEIAGREFGLTDYSQSLEFEGGNKLLLAMNLDWKNIYLNLGDEILNFNKGKAKLSFGTLGKRKLQNLLKKVKAEKKIDAMKDIYPMLESPVSFSFAQDFLDVDSKKNKVKFILSLKKGKNIFDALKSITMKLNGELSQELLSLQFSSFYVMRFLFLNSQALIVEVEDKKPKGWMLGLFSQYLKVSHQVIDGLVEQKYLDKDNDIILVDGKMKDFSLSFNNKVINTPTYNSIAQGISTQALRDFLDKNAMEKASDSIYPFFKFDFGIKVKVPAKQETKAPELVNVQKENLKQRNKDTLFENEDAGDNAFMVSTISNNVRKTKVVQPKKRFKKPDVFRRYHSGIWYDKNRPRVKFHLFQGKNGIFFSEKIVLGKKGKVTRKSKLLFTPKGRYKVSFPAYKTDYTMKPMSRGKIKYSFDKYDGFFN
jgi:hypothetical protein